MFVTLLYFIHKKWQSSLFLASVLILTMGILNNNAYASAMHALYTTLVHRNTLQQNRALSIIGYIYENTL